MDFFDEISDSFAESLAASNPSTRVAAVTCMIEGPLMPEDIQQYLTDHGQLTTTTKAHEKDVALLRERHHSVARLLAEGVPTCVIATTTGYTPEYIGTLAHAPAMMELIAHYKAPGNLAARQIGENLRRVAGMALESIENDLIAGTLTATEKLAAAKLGYDRSGHGPQSSVHSVTEHHLIDHAEIAARNREARQRDAPMIIHPEEVRKALPAPKQHT